MTSCFYATTRAAFTIATLLCVSAAAQLQGNTLVGATNGRGADASSDVSSELEFASLDGAGTQLLTPLQPAPSTVAPQWPLKVVDIVEPLPVMSSPALSASYTELQGGEITGERTLRYSESPFVARQHIEVAKGARLIIEPGVRVEFAPTVGITVRGILHAVVSRV